MEDYLAEITGKVFKIFLEIAQIKNLTLKEMETYKESLSKIFMFYIAKCTHQEGIIENSMQIAIKMIDRKMPIEHITSTGTTKTNKNIING